VLETSSQYYSTLRYPLKDGTFSEHKGIIDIKFCLINVPTKCDPFFGSETNANILNNLLSSLGIENKAIYDEAYCNEAGLPLI
jgi:hypothetical protein